MGGEKQGCGVGLVVKEREREVVNGDDGVISRAIDLERGVAATW